jgi:hypothetical protein
LPRLDGVLFSPGAYLGGFGHVSPKTCTLALLTARVFNDFIEYFTKSDFKSFLNDFEILIKSQRNMVI